MILEYCRSNVGSLLPTEIKFSTAPMFGNHWMQYFSMSLSLLGYQSILHLTLWELKELTLVVFPQGMLPIKGTTSS